MKKQWVGTAWAVAALALGQLAQAAPQFLAEGIWRGEFTVDGEAVPFNFEVQGKDVSDVKFSLINGTRRDYFKVERRDDNTLWVPMNTYDAALEIKIVDGKTANGHYRDLVPKRIGSRDLPFTAEHGKSWRFVAPGQHEAPNADLSGKWAVTQLDKSARADKQEQVALLK